MFRNLRNFVVGNLDMVVECFGRNLILRIEIGCLNEWGKFVLGKVWLVCWLKVSITFVKLLSRCLHECFIFVRRFF